MKLKPRKLTMSMSTAPRLSIGLPVYNGETYLAESIEALLGQSFEDFELIISDNASTDGTADICRRYEKQDPRIRYFRQQRNIGLAPNHNFVFAQSRGDLFKWAASDDLYARDLLQSCVTALDEHPEVVLAHAFEAAIDGEGNVTQALEYPLATDSPRAPERFRSILFGSSGLFERRLLSASNGSAESGDGHEFVRVDNNGILRACDEYGVIRADVMRRIAPLGSYHHADRIIACEIALHGPFHITPDWFYFRREIPDRAYNSSPKVRARCAIQDPARANRLKNPTVRLVAEYFWGYVAAIRRAPLSAADRSECLRYLAQWMADRAACRALPGRFGRTDDRFSAVLGSHGVSARAVVAGQQERLP
jgi:glycosyltransferase involved in cell wall biosynthesis